MKFNQVFFRLLFHDINIPLFILLNICCRLCEADVLGSSLVALSHSGSVCVWELERPGEPRIVWAPESEGWQLARWGSDNILLTALHSGDIILQHYRHTQVVVHEEERNLT